MWPFRSRHDPADAPTVQEAREKRDLAFDKLDEAVEVVEGATAEVDRVLSDYLAAEKARVARSRQRRVSGQR